MPNIAGNFETYAQLLKAPNVAPEKKLQAATEIRDSIEIVHTSEYPTFLKVLFPAFHHLLALTEPQMVEGALQRTRNIVLEVLNRLPSNDALRPYVSDLLKLALQLLHSDNEDNALICLRIIIDLHKTYRPQLDSEVQNFLNIVQSIYQQLPATVEYIFTTLPAKAASSAPSGESGAAAAALPPGAAATTGQGSAPAAPGEDSAAATAAPGSSASAGPAAASAASSSSSASNQPRALIKSMQSFKVLTECPIIVVLLFQLYQRFVQDNIPRFLPLIVDTLMLEAPSGAAEKHRQAYHDFVAAQVKTLSFLAYILRSFADVLRPFQERIPRAVIQLLKHCPADSANTRKELLIATRHILATDFRQGFVTKIDDLLSEQALIGTGRTAYETLRPLAYNTLADLVHHVRAELSLAQLSKVVYIYSRNIHDPSLPQTIQTMSGKLLLNILECILKRSEGNIVASRTLLLQILDAFVAKFATLRDFLDALIATHPKLAAAAAAAASRSPALRGTAATASGTTGNSGAATAISSASAAAGTTPGTGGGSSSSGSGGDSKKSASADGAKAGEQAAAAGSKKPSGLPEMQAKPDALESVRDSRIVVKTLVVGLRTIVWSITNNANAAAAAAAAGAAAGTTPAAAAAAVAMTPEQADQFTRFFRDAMRCFVLYAMPPSPGGNEEKEILDHFAAVFTMLDARTFQYVFKANMEVLFQALLRNQVFLTIPQHLLANPAVSKYFAQLLIDFLVQHLDDLSDTRDKVRAAVLLRLFKLLFGSVKLFPENEPVVQPHLAAIVTKCTESPGLVTDPVNYFLLLKALFRSIGGGKFDLLYKEFLPLLPGLLRALNRLQTDPVPMYDRSLQRSKTQPRTQLPGMRDLFTELCLTVPVRLSALLPHLHLLMRPLILALSASNELVTQGLRTVELFVENLNPLYLDPVLLPVRTELMLALWSHVRPPPYPRGGHALRLLGKLGGRNRRFLSEPLDLTYKPNAEDGFHVTLTFEPDTAVLLNLDLVIARARATLSPHIDPFRRTQAFVFLRTAMCALITLDSTLSTAYSMAQPGSIAPVAPTPATNAKLGSLLQAQVTCVRELLVALLGAAEYPELRESGMQLFGHLTRHFTLAFLSTAFCPISSEMHLSPTVFLEALTEGLSHENRHIAHVASQAILIMIKTADAMCGGIEAAYRYSVWHLLCDLLVHQCYRDAWRSMAGGCLGLQQLVDSLPPQWLRRHEVRISEALLYVMRHLDSTVSTNTLVLARKVYDTLIRRANDPAAGATARTEPHEIANLRTITGRMAAQLCSPVERVRECVAAGLATMSKLMDKPEAGLLDSVKKELITHILRGLLEPSSLRNNPAVATGLLSALAQCIRYSPAMLAHEPAKLTDVLLRALEECDVDETVMIGARYLIEPNTPAAALLPVAITPPVHGTAPTASISSPAMVALTKELLKGPRASDYRAHVGLAVAAIRLLSVALDMPMSASSPTSDRDIELRNRSIGVFFRALTCTTPEIVAVGHSSLSQVLAHQKLPKDLLSNSLRPILLNLADHRRLTVPLLDGLARLLELLTSCFNVALGEKLLEHLRNWLDPAKLQAMTVAMEEQIAAVNRVAAVKVTGPNDVYDIAAAVINVFHLLPPQAIRFLEHLITLTLMLEQALPVNVVSPYRLPLCRFLNKYASEVASWLPRQLNKQPCARLFQWLLRQDYSAPLRAALRTKVDEVLRFTLKLVPNGGLPSDQVWDLQFQGIQLLESLITADHDWIRDQTTVTEALFTHWNSRGRAERLAREASLSIEHRRESVLLINCFLVVLKHRKIDLLFHLLSIFTVRSCVDYTFLRNFYFNTVAKEYTIEEKTTILKRFITFYTNRAVSPSHKAYMLQLLVIPILDQSYHNPNQPEDSPMVDQDTVAKLIGEILAQQNADIASCDESLSIELLQLSTLLLVRSQPKRIGEFRRDLIKFAWNHLRSEDMTIRQCAYLMVCRYIEANETPHKIILQVYVALLRHHQPEARGLVRQALDVLAPALPKRVPVGENHKYPAWIKYMKKIIVEEGHSLPQLMHIWHLLVRHPYLFYPSRGQFVPPIVNSLARIGLPQNSTQENRKLAVDLADLIISWELERIRRARSKAAGGAGGAAVTSDTAGAEPPLKRMRPNGTPLRPDDEKAIDLIPDDEFQASAPVVEMVVQVLIRMSCLVGESSESQALSQRCMALLRQALRVWPRAPIKFVLFDKLFNPSTSVELSTIGLDILNVIVGVQGDDFLLPNTARLREYLAPSMTRLDNTKVVASLCVFLRLVLRHHPEADAPQPLRELYAWVAECIATALSTVQDKGTAQAADKWTIQGIVMLIKSISSGNLPFMDRYLAPLVKVISKLAKEHVAAGGGAPTGPRQDVTETTQSTDLVVRTLMLCMSLVSLRVLGVSDQRKTFISCLLGLIDKSRDAPLLHEVTKIVGSWLLARSEDKDSSLTVKEKTAFLLRMTCFENLPYRQLQRAYLEHVYKVFDSPTTPRNAELVQKLQPAFMMGLRASDRDLRNRFFVLFGGSVTRSMPARMTYILDGHDWSTVPETYWIKQACDMLLSSFVPHQKLLLSRRSAMVRKLSENPVKAATASVAMSGIQVLDDHQRWLRDVARYTVTDMLTPLRELSHYDHQLVHTLWITIFPVAWSHMQRSDQEKLTKSLISLFGAEYHDKFKRRRPNNIQTLLEALARSEPQPRIPAPLLRFLAAKHNAWHDVLPMLEKQVSKAGADETTFDFLAQMYEALNETDLWYGVMQRRVKSPYSRAALVYQRHGFWDRAQDTYLNAMTAAQMGAMTNVAPSELAIWEAQWIECARQLSQWDVLNDFAKGVQHNTLRLECACVLPDWDAVRDLTTKHKNDASLWMRMCQIASTVHEGKLSDVDALYTDAVGMALRQWASLPSVAPASRIPLLQVFQQLVEITEATHMLHALHTNASQLQSVVQDIKSTLTTWRERLPNVWDSVKSWNALLTWRQHVFFHLNRALQPLGEENSNITTLGIYETSWTINTFSKIARKHGLVEVCLNSLSKIYALPTIEIQDAFVKLREQIKCYFLLPANYRTGLDIINSTNLGYFLDPQKAEFFRLKAEFQAITGNQEEANTNFGRSLEIYGNQPKGWVSYGLFCDRIFVAAPSKTEWAVRAASCLLQGVRCGSRRARRLLARVFMLLDADSANFAQLPQKQSVIKTVAHYAEHLPAWIWLPFLPQLFAGLQRPEADLCRDILRTLAEEYPQAVYYPLRTALLTHQARIGHVTAAAAATATSNANASSGGTAAPTGASIPSTPLPTSASGVATAQQQQQGSSDHGPSAADQAGSGGVGTAAPQSSQTSPSAAAVAAGTGLVLSQARDSVLERLKAVRASLQAHDAKVIEDLDRMIGELESKMRPNELEQMAGVLQLLLDKCHRYQSSTFSAEMVQLFERVSSVCFRFPADQVGRVEALPPVIAPYYQLWQQHFGAGAALAGKPVLEVVGHLHKLVSQVQVKAGMRDMARRVLFLESMSNLLVSFRPAVPGSIEIPGQYLEEGEANPTQHVRLLRLAAEVERVARHGTMTRLVTMIGSDGRRYPFMVQSSTFTKPPTDERMHQLQRQLNVLLRKHNETCMRNVAFHIPMMVSCSPTMRLVEDSTTFVPLEDIYGLFCALRNRHIDQSIVTAKQRLIEHTAAAAAAAASSSANAAAGSGAGSTAAASAGTGAASSSTSSGTATASPGASAVELRLKVYQDLCNEVPESILSHYMMRTVAAPDQLFLLKKQFTLQYALTSFLCHVLHLPSTPIHRILVSKNSGRVVHTDLRPVYTQSGLLHSPDPVSVRLTRNLVTFITPLGLEGPFTSVFSAVAQCLTMPKVQLDTVLGLFLRDDLLSGTGHDVNAVSAMTKQLLHEKINTNVRQVMKRVADLAPVRPAPARTSSSTTSPAADASAAATSSSAAGSSGTGGNDAATSSGGGNGSGGSGANASSPPVAATKTVVNRAVGDLLSANTSPARLAMLSPANHPWF